ncbi:HNH endonuclease [Amycolatopsis sp. Poz14]|nr:HNH endonuclease signature motif containing protein [Amycolatopsis sp. Poz14]MCG3754680.1 HNH endonuclease [Amycolatopsis sp. Poz14]
MAWNTSNRRDRLPRDWHRIRRDILKRDPQCRLHYTGCTGRSTEVDHIERGDNHAYSNLQGVCTKCHATKSAREGRQTQLTRRARRFRPSEEHPGNGLMQSKPTTNEHTENEKE